MTRQELLNKRLKEYIEAEEGILGGAQSYTIGGRTLTRANLSYIRKTIDLLLEQGATLEEGAKERVACYVKRVVMLDV